MPGCAPCNCKLSIIGVCLAAVCSSLQVATIYLDKFEDSFDKTWFAIVSLILNSFLAGIHAFQIGLKNRDRGTEEEKKDTDVSQASANASQAGDDVEVKVIQDRSAHDINRVSSR